MQPGAGESLAAWMVIVCTAVAVCAVFLRLARADPLMLRFRLCLSLFLSLSLFQFSLFIALSLSLSLSLFLPIPIPVSLSDFVAPSLIHAVSRSFAFLPFVSLYCSACLPIPTHAARRVLSLHVHAAARAHLRYNTNLACLYRLASARAGQAGLWRGAPLQALAASC